MSKYPMKHICSCPTDEIDWVQVVKYQPITRTQNSPTYVFDNIEKAKKFVEDANDGKNPIKEEPYVYVDYLPVLVCQGCDKEVLENKQNWYDNWVRQGEHFYNDLDILLANLAHYMQLADKDGSLEFKGITIASTNKEGEI